MNKLTIDEYAKDAIQEAVGWYTIAIDAFEASSATNWGTGSLIEKAGRKFILTCEHIVEKKFRDEDLNFLYRTSDPMGWISKEEIKTASLDKFNKLRKVFPQKLPIVNRLYSDAPDDLVLLELNSSSNELESYQFYQIPPEGVTTPAVGTKICLMGFSQELARRVTRGGIGIFAYFCGSKIKEKTYDIPNFDIDRHFVIDYARDGNSVNPHGLSGSGVWAWEQSEKGKLWTPKIYLAGIQTDFLKKSENLVGTRAERVIKLLEKIR